jgi:hypothetical protein
MEPVSEDLSLSWRVLRVTLGASLLVASTASTGLAQDTTAVRLIGEVRNFDTEQPVADIAVKVVELGLVAVTDRNGFFAFDGLAPGRWTFEASGFGYRTNVEASAIGPRSLLLIRLEPAPVELEGLHVSVVRELVRRRMAAPSRVFAWDKADLEAAISPDIGSFVGNRGVAQFAACGGEFAANDLPNCFWRRGHLVRLRLFVDDIEQLEADGMGRLWSFDPRDLWSVEFLPGCRQLRIYTQLFMEHVEQGRVRLVPVLCG